MVHVSTQAGLRVVVLAGGDSPERPVSLASGEQVAAALTRGRPSGSAVRSSGRGSRDVSLGTSRRVLSGAARRRRRGWPRATTSGVRLACRSRGATRGPRDWRCAKAPEGALFQVGVPTQPYVLMHQADSVADVASKTASLRFPLIVKPDSQGSSLGLGIWRAPATSCRRPSERRRRSIRSRLSSRLSSGANSPWQSSAASLCRCSRLSHRPGCSITKPNTKVAMTEYRFDTGLLPETVAEIEHAAVAAAEALSTSGPGARRFDSGSHGTPVGARGEHDSRHDAPQPCAEGGCAGRHGSGRALRMDVGRLPGR